MKVGLKLEEILEATGGKLIRRGEAESWLSFCRDSRKVKKGDFFIPLKGERFDGHDFIEDAVMRGATGSLWGREDSPNLGITLIGVKDTLEALGKMGDRIRRKWGGEIVGITGSAGKTTTKEIIWAGLSAFGNVHKTPGNYNNLVGVPISLLALSKEDRFSCVEMGMNSPGEIAKLAEIAAPDWSIITSIGPAHIGAFKDLSGIEKEKGSILDFTKKGAVFPAGHPLLTSKATKSGIRFITTGPAGELELVRWQKEKLIIRYIDTRLEFDIQFSTPVEAEDFTHALGIAILMQLDLDRFVDGVRENYTPPERRSRIYKGKFTVIDDSYNANPLSTKKALELLGRISGKRKIFIFGDMLELGEQEEKLHREIGEYVAESGIDTFVVIGRRAYWSGEEAEKRGVNTFFVENFMELEQLMDIILGENDVVLVKASRAMRLERIVDYLLKKIEVKNAV